MDTPHPLMIVTFIMALLGIAAAASAAEPIKPVAMYHFDVIAATDGRLAQGSPNFAATYTSSKRPRDQASFSRTRTNS